MEGPSSEQAAHAQRAFPFGCYIEHTERRGVTLEQLQRIISYATEHCGGWHNCNRCSQTVGQQLSIATLNLYHLCHWLIMPATKPADCAFVELLASGPQTPRWFVSHWWGELVGDFVRCVEKHSQIRCVGGDSPYWVCAYANRQHSLGTALTLDPRETSFFKAMQLSDGVLLILDDKTDHSGPATPFTRVWCAFEEAMVLETAADRDSALLFDIAAQHGDATELLTDGVATWDTKQPPIASPERHKAIRERTFPIEVIRAGLELQLENAQASVPDDALHILNCLADRPLDARPALEEHENYTKLNVKLRAVFAVAAWRQMLERGLVAQFQLPKVLAADAWRTDLQIDFTSCECMDDENLGMLARAFPKQLRSLRIDLTLCVKLTDKGLSEFANHLPNELETCMLWLKLCDEITAKGIEHLSACLPASLRHIHFDFLTLKQINDRAVSKLGARLPKALEHCCLRFAGLHDLSDTSLASLGMGLPRSLARMNLDFSGCLKLGDSGLAAIAISVSQLEGLQNLGMNFVGCQEIGDPGLASLAKGLPSGLRELSLEFKFCDKVTDVGLAMLAHHLPRRLRTLHLNFNCTSVSDKRLELSESLDVFRAWRPNAPDVCLPRPAAAPAVGPRDRGVAVNRVRLLFRAFDRDHSGYMSRAQFSGLLQALGMNTGESRALFNAVDVDGDGKVDVDELVDFLFSTKDRASAMLRAVNAGSSKDLCGMARGGSRRNRAGPH